MPTKQSSQKPAASKPAPKKRRKAPPNVVEEGLPEGRMASIFRRFAFLKKIWPRQLSALMEDSQTTKDVLEDEQAAYAAYMKMMRRVVFRSFLIVGLAVAIFILFPVFKPIYQYEAVRPDGKKMALVSLSAPNLTDDAILYWSVTSITEILTFGFGDFDSRILAQRKAFTDKGWQSFTKAVRDQQMREKFRERQLVLTTVPADSPVIVGKGPDKDGLYKWLVEMPIVMTYTTNNNVTSRKKGIVRLLLVRVPVDENENGIGIQKWMLI